MKPKDIHAQPVVQPSGGGSGGWVEVGKWGRSVIMSTTRTKKPETWPHRRAWDTRGVSLGTGDRKSKRRGTSCEGRWEQAACPWEGITSYPG